MKEHNENLEKGEIEIVEPTIEDSEAIGKVLAETWLATYPNEELGITKEDMEQEVKKFDSDERLEQRRKNIEQKDPKAHMWVAKVEGEVVGVCRATKKDEGYRIESLYVLPDYQGRGIGKRFMEKVFEWLGNDRDIYVNVAEYNTNAIEFYKKLGFSLTENPVHSESAVLKSGKTIPEIEMMREGGEL